LSETKPIILKIGGSVITDKNGDLAAKTEVINRLAEEVAKANVKSLIVVHGGGSFGHPTAEKHGIKDGFKQDGQRIGFAETHHVMTVLNGLVMDAFVWHEIPAVSIAPSSCVITENGRIKQFEDAALRMLMKMQFTPVLYGDTTVDEKLGFTVLSGDQIVTHLALKFKACKIIMGVDTDGLYDADPKEDKNAKLYQHLSLKELCTIQGKLAKPTSADVTGGMFGKMNEMVPAVEKGIPVSIVNGAKTGRVYKALVGERVEGTLIERA
jgi:isopentenyl phosphate kinase